MASVAKKAILKALIDSVITELMIKTTGEQVYLDDNTTLSSKIAEMIAAINLRAKSTDVTLEIAAAISNLRKELMGETVDAAYDTFTELANYISQHQDVADSLTSAIGNKADKSTVTAIQNTINALGSLATKNTVSESDLDSALKEKVNAAAEGNHSHSNKSLLDTYDQTNANIKDAVLKKHSHSNKTVLDGISASNIANWNSKSAVYISSSQPSGLTPGDLWVQTLG